MYPIGQCLVILWLLRNALCSSSPAKAETSAAEFVALAKNAAVAARKHQSRELTSRDAPLLQHLAQPSSSTSMARIVMPRQRQRSTCFTATLAVDSDDQQYSHGTAAQILRVNYHSHHPTQHLAIHQSADRQCCTAISSLLAVLHAGSQLRSGCLSWHHRMPG